VASLPALMASAQDFPARPIRIVVPFAAGGGSDTSARLAAEPLGRQLGVGLYVENRDGSGGLVGTETFLRSEADGYSILAAGVAPTVIIPAMRPTSYSAERNLIPLGQISASAQALAVRKDLPVRKLAEFVAYAKAAPGKLTIGSAGAGTLTQVAAALMEREWGITLSTVPFRGGGALLPALVGGHIDVAIADTTTFAALHNSGDLRVLATLSTRRSAALPEVPTMLEGRLQRGRGRELDHPDGERAHAQAHCSTTAGCRRRHAKR
jgi:tripartite-type tricarboxylate transporter receptor subunit TctC